MFIWPQRATEEQRATKINLEELLYCLKPSVALCASSEALWASLHIGLHFLIFLWSSGNSVHLKPSFLINSSAAVGPQLPGT